MCHIFLKSKKLLSIPFDGPCSTTNFSYIYYKQRENLGPEGVLGKKNFQNHISGFVADFAGFAHIYVSYILTKMRSSRAKIDRNRVMLRTGASHYIQYAFPKRRRRSCPIKLYVHIALAPTLPTVNTRRTLSLAYTRITLQRT